MEAEEGNPQTELTVHDRLYNDFFARKTNRERLLRHIDEQYRGLAYPVLTHTSLKLFERRNPPTFPSEDQVPYEQPEPAQVLEPTESSSPLTYSRLKVPEMREEERTAGSEGSQTSPLSSKEMTTLFSLRKDSPERVSPQLSPVAPVNRRNEAALSARKGRFRVGSLLEMFNPMIGKYYSQLTPFKQTISYRSGCDTRKIIKSGKKMVSYSDSKGMMAALSQKAES